MIGPRRHEGSKKHQVRIVKLFSTPKTFVFLRAFEPSWHSPTSIPPQKKSSPRHLLFLFSPRQNLRVSSCLRAFVATLRGNHPHPSFSTKIISAPPPFPLFSAAKPSCFFVPSSLRGNPPWQSPAPIFFHKNHLRVTSFTPFSPAKPSC